MRACLRVASPIYANPLWQIGSVAVPEQCQGGAEPHVTANEQILASSPSLPRKCNLKHFAIFKINYYRGSDDNGNLIRYILLVGYTKYMRLRNFLFI